jgi:hypothetical protein
MRFEVLAAVSISNLTLKMKAETLMATYKESGRHNTKDHNRHGNEALSFP